MDVPRHKPSRFISCFCASLSWNLIGSVAPRWQRSALPCGAQPRLLPRAGVAAPARGLAAPPPPADESRGTRRHQPVAVQQCGAEFGVIWCQCVLFFVPSNSRVPFSVSKMRTYCFYCCTVCPSGALINNSLMGIDLLAPVGRDYLCISACVTSYSTCLSSI